MKTITTRKCIVKKSVLLYSICFLDDDAVPPKLPPKRSSSNLLRAQGEPGVILPLLNENANNNKAKLHDKSSALSSFHIPSPPSNSEREEEDRSGDSLLSTPRSLTPTFKPPPPPPKATVGIVKHETFSGPMDRKKKPPVPPKPAAVNRSASLRPPVRNRPSELGRSFSRDDQEILKARQKNQEENLIADLYHNKKERNPNTRNKPKNAVEMTMPSAPQL